MLPGIVIGTRFEIESVAAVGGMGTVYRALDRVGGGRVALKLIGLASHERFLREAQLLAELRHPHIIRYVAHGETGPGELFLAMEWIDGEDLGARLRRAPLSMRESMILAQRVAAALAVAHARGVVHRDLKPSNLLLPGGDVGAVKLLDFGVAYLDEAAGSVTRTGSIVGTPSYMAPEQARGQRPLTPRADVFSLGAVLFECLTGQPPFEGDGVLAVMAKIVLDPTPHARSIRPELSPALNALLMRLLAKNPDERPADGSELLRELAALGDVDALDGPPPPPRAHPGGLTTSEMRVVCVLMFRLGNAEQQATAATLTPDQPRELDATFAAVQATAASFGGRCERLLEGTVLVTLTGAGAATDQAAQAARCALAIRALIPGAPMALATGRALVDGRSAVGEAIDRALRSLDADSSHGGISVDELSTRLAGDAFEVRTSGNLRTLEGERSTASVRTLLGRSSPCVGRDRELALIDGLVAECLDEHAARALLIVGPAGAGKSRIAYELVQRLRAGGRVERIWIARGDPLRNGSPFGLMAQLVRAACDVAEAEPLETRRAKLHACVTTLMPGDDGERVALFLGELIGAPFAVDRPDLDAARSDQRLMGEQIHRVFAEWLAAACAKDPLVLLLEDLQWGDLPSVLAIDSGLRALAERPLFVLALGRPEVKDSFPNLWSERAMQEVRLMALGKKASETLVRQMLGDSVSDERVARIVEHAGGNAFFLEELIRAAAENAPDTPPETVLAMTQLRLERFPAELRMVLRAASIFGPNFWRAGVAELLGFGDRLHELDESLRALIEREVIVRVAGGHLANQEELRFRHALLRDAAYSALTPDDRMLGHRMAARWLESAGERDPLLLAQHLERGGDLANAIGWLVRAAEQAFEASDLSSTLRIVERGIACGAFGEALGALHATAAEAAFHGGEFIAGRDHGRAAYAAAPHGSNAWYRAIATLLALTQQSIVTPLPEIVAAVRQAPPPSEPLPPHFLVWFVIASTFLIVDMLDEAASFQRRMEEALPRAKSPMALVWTLYGRCLVATIRDHDPDLAYCSVSEAADIALRVADERAWVFIELQRAICAVGIGAAEEAETRARSVLASRFGVGLARAMGDLFLSRALTNLGRLDEARQHQRAALDSFTHQGNTMFAGYARHHGAVLSALDGDAAAAEREASAALDEILSPRHRSAVLATLADARLTLGQTAEALETARAAYQAARYGTVEDGKISAYLSYVRALQATGDVETARAIAVEARERLNESCELFTDAGRRARYLALPDHVRLLALRL